MKRKLLSVSVILVLLLTMLSACSKDTAETKAEETKKETKAETAKTETTGETEAKESEGGNYKIGFAVSTLANEFFVEMKDAAEAKAADMGIELVVLDAQDSTETQATQVEDLITQKVDFIILNPCLLYTSRCV